MYRPVRHALDGTGPPADGTPKVRNPGPRRYHDSPRATDSAAVTMKPLRLHGNAGACIRGHRPKCRTGTGADVRPERLPRCGALRGNARRHFRSEVEKRQGDHKRPKHSWSRRRRPEPVRRPAPCSGRGMSPQPLRAGGAARASSAPEVDKAGVTVGDRVEGPGMDGGSRHRSPPCVDRRRPADRSREARWYLTCPARRACRNCHPGGSSMPAGLRSVSR